MDQFEREVVEMVKPCHGTTTLGFIFEHGVIIAVDSRATMGSYICKSCKGMQRTSRVCSIRPTHTLSTAACMCMQFARDVQHQHACVQDPAGVSFMQHPQCCGFSKQP